MVYDLLPRRIVTRKKYSIKHTFSYFFCYVYSLYFVFYARDKHRDVPAGVIVEVWRCVVKCVVLTSA